MWYSSTRHALIGVGAYKISTIVDSWFSLPRSVVGVRPYKISTIVDVPRAAQPARPGVRPYKISTIVDYLCQRLVDRAVLDRTKFLLL